MPKLQYGKLVIDYSTQVNEGLSGHYISVSKETGVVLKGKKVSAETARKLILKKAGWIIDKLKIVGAGHEQEGKIVTGARIPYLGKSYYVQLIPDSKVKEVQINFTWSKFEIRIRNNKVSQQAILKALGQFYYDKAAQKILPRAAKLAEQTGLAYKSISIRKMRKRWGSCTPANSIIINPEAIKLSFTLIDYLIIHELCHTRVKDHSKAFWAELSKHVGNWRELDERVGGYGV